MKIVGDMRKEIKMESNVIKFKIPEKRTITKNGKKRTNFWDVYNEHPYLVGSTITGVAASVCGAVSRIAVAYISRGK